MLKTQDVFDLVAHIAQTYHVPHQAPWTSCMDPICCRARGLVDGIATKNLDYVTWASRYGSVDRERQELLDVVSEEFRVPRHTEYVRTRFAERELRVVVEVLRLDPEKGGVVELIPFSIVSLAALRVASHVRMEIDNWVSGKRKTFPSSEEITDTEKA